MAREGGGFMPTAPPFLRTVPSLLTVNNALCRTI